MMDRRKRARLKRVLASMRLNFIAFAALIVIAVIGISLIRSTLFDNAWETGTSMAHNYAAEEQSSLTMYETLLTFGTASIDDRTKQGLSLIHILAPGEVAQGRCLFRQYLQSPARGHALTRIKSGPSPSRRRAVVVALQTDVLFQQPCAEDRGERHHERAL